MAKAQAAGLTPTDFEKRLSDVAKPLIGTGKTGYVLKPVSDLLASELSMRVRCKQANRSGRGANVLVESNDKETDLYVVFIAKPYTAEQFRKVAKNRIQRFERVKTVAIAELVNGVWRVKELIERRGADVARRIKERFPLVLEVLEVDAALPPAEHASVVVEEAPAEVPTEDPERVESAAIEYKARVDGLRDLLDAFTKFAADADISLNSTMAVDLLAAAMSSQFALFAGPSGTGKSTMARVLATFFAPENARAVLEARRQWIGPEDAFGYYSPLAEHFALAADTDKLIDLHEASLGLVRGDAAVPFLVVEEINLSPVEGYLAPMIHGLSAPSVPLVRWSLHGKSAGARDADGTIVVPRDILLGPFPRLLGTINVDQTSIAPARKVSARACVLLLEADSRVPATATAMLGGAGRAFEASGDAVGRAWIGDPSAARLSLTDAGRRDLLAALQKVVEVAVAGQAVPAISLSSRDLFRCGNYMAYFASLCETVEPAPANGWALAAENALLHFVLPVLAPEHFRAAVDALLKGGLADPPADEKHVGGQLRPRLERVAAASTRFAFSEALDFWASLS